MAGNHGRHATKGVDARGTASPGRAVSATLRAVRENVV
jgi:hypothetical protein